MIGGAWENKAGRTIPERMCPGEAERKAAHRLLSNHEVGMDEFPEQYLEAHDGRRSAAAAKSAIAEFGSDSCGWNFAPELHIFCVG